MAGKQQLSATDADQARPARSCATCRHYRIRTKAHLFNATELQTAAGLKAHSELQQREKQHAEREAHLLAAGGVFTYEPRHYAWCAAFTPSELLSSRNPCPSDRAEALVRDGVATIDPVSGRISPIYALCARTNAHGDCSSHVPR